MPTLAAEAATVTLNATDTGWYSETGSHSPSSRNYFVGREYSEVYRNWILFEIPVNTPPIVGASLNINTFSIGSPDASETYEMHEVKTPFITLTNGGTGLTNIYNDLGDGTLYGSKEFTTNDANQIINIPLNSDAVSNIMAAMGAQFAIGGVITTLNSSPTSFEFVFGYSYSPQVNDVQIILTYADVPIITSQPTNQTVLLSSNAIFSVTATGSAPLAYQWYFNGTNIFGGTNSSLTLTNVTVSQQGNYFAIVTNSGGSVTSLVATLTVVVPPPPPATEIFAVWANRYNGPANSHDSATAVAVDGSGNVFVTGNSGASGSGSDYATIKYSSEGVALWTNRYNGPLNNDDRARAVAVDGGGNVFVTGTSYGTNGSGTDYATIKYSGEGVALWTNRYSGPGFYVTYDDQANAMAVDASGNVFVTGNSPGTNSYGNGITSAYATIAYSGAGVALWTNRYSAFGADYAKALAVDGSGNVFVTGDSEYGTGRDYATIKYSGAGVALWTNRYNGPANGDDHAEAMAVDTSGNVFVTGASAETNRYPDYVTIKYSGAGEPLWTNRYNFPGVSVDIATAIAVDTNGDVFVTGDSSDDSARPDYATIKYSAAGVPLWTNRYDGALRLDHATAVAVDGSGNVFVTGYSSQTAGFIYDYATIAYSGAGVPLWTNRYNGPWNYDDKAVAMAVDGSGNVFVTGYSYSANDNPDYATIKYSATPPSLTPPSLTIARTTENAVVVSWPSPSTGFTLQSTTNLVSPAVWNTNLPSPVVINGQNTVTNPISGTQQFFRLSQ